MRGEGGHAWLRGTWWWVCMAGVMHGRGCTWQETCVAGEACVAGETAIAPAVRILLE